METLSFQKSRKIFLVSKIDVDTDSPVLISVRNFPVLFIFPRTSYDIAFVIVRVASIGNLLIRWREETRNDVHTNYNRTSC